MGDDEGTVEGTVGGTVTTVAMVVGGLAAVAVAAWIGITFNRFVRRRAQVELSGAQIDVQLERRHDLIPSLVDVVKGYATHERQTLEAVIRARTEALTAIGGARGRQAEVEDQLTRMLERLLAVGERHPTLQASEQFLNLQAELVDTENRIAYARQFYNGAVRTLNTAVDSFPDGLIATVGGFRRHEYFEAVGTREVPGAV